MAIPKLMSGVVLTGHGGPEMLSYKNDLIVLVPKANEVLIRVAAAGVNNTDINTRTAWYSKGDQDGGDASWSGEAIHFPLIQGADVCGQIVATGSGIDKTRLGERVLIEPCIREFDGKTLDTAWYFGSECNGGFAQYTTVASRHAYKVESAFKSTSLASFPCSYSTAENMLTRANVTSADRILVTGASGGVGSATIQLAKARGAHVIAVTGAAKAQALLDIGADEIVDRNDGYLSPLGQNSVDVVIDLVAGDRWVEILEVLRPAGRYAVAGAIAGPMVTLDIRTLYLKDLSFFGCTVLEPQVFGNLIKRIENRDIQPLVWETYPLEQLTDAQASFENKQHIGKIVVTID